MNFKSRTVLVSKTKTQIMKTNFLALFLLVCTLTKAQDSETNLLKGGTALEFGFNTPSLRHLIFGPESYTPNIMLTKTYNKNQYGIGLFKQSNLLFPELMTAKPDRPFYTSDFTPFNAIQFQYRRNCLTSMRDNFELNLESSVYFGQQDLDYNYNIEGVLLTQTEPAIQNYYGMRLGYQMKYWMSEKWSLNHSAGIDWSHVRNLSNGKSTMLRTFYSTIGFGYKF